MSANESDNTLSEASGDTKIEDFVKPEVDKSSGNIEEVDSDKDQKQTLTESDKNKGSETETENKESVTFKVIFSKQKHDVTFPIDETVLNLKSHLEKLTSVPVSMQKVMFRGLMKDEATLRESKITKGSKVMLVGSTVTDVLSVSAPDPKVLKEEEKKEAAANKEPLSKQKPHKTVLEKHGKPDDVPPGIKKSKEPLPQVPLSGMYNKSGGKVRLTFKLELDQLWIGTKERTDKIPMGSIKAVVSEPIDGHEEYHLMGIQLGPTEASRYWVYWVPAQYVDAIKDSILGKWQFF